MTQLLAVITGFLVAAGVWLLLVGAQVGNKTPSSQWVREAYQHKNDRALSIRQKKVVIVAGSNALFGMNSSLLSSYYHYPVVNQGVNAGIGLPFIVKQAKAVLNPGDIALLPIEHGLYNYDDDTNHVMIDYYFTEAELFHNLAIKLKLKMLAQISLKRVFEGYQGLPAGFKVAGLYGPQNMDVNGDQTNSSIQQRQASQLAGLENQAPSRYGQDAPANPSAWKILIDFQQYANANNICLIYIPATMMYNELYRSNADEFHFYSEIPAIAKHKGLTYLGEPMDFMYETGNYFDTNYHLVSESRARHTSKVIALLGPDLKSHCGKTSP